MARKRRLERVYADALGGVGAYGSWPPSRWIWPGSTGSWRNEVFYPDGGVLSTTDWGYHLEVSANQPEIFSTTGVASAEIAGGGSVSDPLNALKAGAELAYGVSSTNQVLFITPPGFLWEIADVQALQEQIRSELANWDLGAMVVCSVIEIPQGVVGVSSRSTTSFLVSGDAGGPVHIGVKAKGKARGRLASQMGYRRLFPLVPKAKKYPQPNSSSTSKQRKRVAYSPLFRDAFRVSSDILTKCGIRNRRLVTVDGKLIHKRIERSEREDRVYDPRGAEMSLKELQELPVAQLFESVPPETLYGEFDAEAKIAQEMIGV